MFNQKKWFVLFAALFLGLSAYVFVPEEFIRTANAETKKEFTRVTLENKMESSKASVDLVSAEDVWKDVFKELKYGEMTGEKLAALALAEVKNRDLELMSSSTDHIVNYHGKRFAITDDDYQVLLQIVQTEASTEDVIGRILVANVVLNRREIGFGGDTIAEVVFDEGQFAPVSNGRIFRVKPDEVTIEAVERALNGEDHSRGALYFMQRDAASKRGIRWFDNHLTFLFKHGCHEFFTEKD
jgi:spore germination cell wall hydrolase CwlJ-like protein